MSKRLRKQWRWVAVAVAIVALAILSRSAEARLSNVSDNRQASTCQVQVNADVLNVRAGPSRDTPTVGKLNRGAKVDAQPVVQTGFRKLTDTRWVAEEFVTPTGC